MPIEKQNQASKKPLIQPASGVKHASSPGHDLDGLRAKIRQIEGRQTPFPEKGVNCLSTSTTTSPARMPVKPAAKRQQIEDRLWNFGLYEIDGTLPGNELSRAALHEIKPASYRDTHAALGFAMALAGRRAASEPDATLLWCLPPLFSNEFGAPYGPGLRRFLPRPENCLITQPKTHAHLLWAMEEGLNAQAFGLVLATMKNLEPTPARRLSLRAGRGRTPALLLTHHEQPGINMAETRWRIKRAQSENTPHLTTAPGPARWAVTLERAPRGKGGLKWILEWRHETLSFTLASRLADRTPQAARAATGSAGRGFRTHRGRCQRHQIERR